MIYFKNILLLVLSISLGACKSSKQTPTNPVETTKQTSTELKTGAERTELYLPQLQGKSVALIVNQTSVVGQNHLVDFLLDKKVKITKIFAPEHGFRGDAEAGEKIKDGKDTKTGLPIVSLHGNKYKPTETDLADVDVVIFDIQDVGVRFYTYISTLLYAMEACAENKKSIIVLDRPNPNGNYVDGPVLDMKFKSFVGIAPIPVVHGLTVGEFAKMCNGEGWLANKLKCNLQVVECQNYTHDTFYDIKIAPSPNLKNTRSILLYPSICFFEGTNVSLGRGTDTPFEIIGHPALKGKYEFSFTPKPNAAATTPPQNGKMCYGVSFLNENEKTLFARKQLDFKYLFEFFKPVSAKEDYFLKNNFFDKLAGTDTFRKAILEGKSETEIRKTWQPELEKYQKMRSKYLIYQ
jgi:uncharacterized protein YbbC (DUF1343 family)